MKQILVIALLALAPLAAGAQTLNVHMGNVTYLFPASQTGDMVFSQGTSLTLMGRTFALADIDDMTISDTPVTDNLVAVVYSGSSATVTVAGNAARYVSPAISGAHVEIATTNTEAVDGDELTIQLAGSSFHFHESRYIGLGPCPNARQQRETRSMRRPLNSRPSGEKS